MIGRGAQGVVLKVFHLEWNQELALKLPLPQLLASPVSRGRFLREAQTWIQLGLHPHIVRCWFVKPVTSLPGLFLDYVSGSLASWLKQRPKGDLDTLTVVRMLLGAAEGLAHSHSLGVVHRDVKPANLLLDAAGRIQVTDFGLVKNTADQSDSDELDHVPPVVPSAAGVPFDPNITGAGEFVGTPGYGAPEQWEGGYVGPGTDIYSFGIVLYEMLCGRQPFEEPESEAQLGRLIVDHLYNQPPDPREFNPGIPAKLADLSLKCLQKKAEERPPSMRAVISVLTPIYNELSSQEYQAPARVPEGERPDLLNNAAVSLYSLGDTETATKLLKRGLRLEAGHAECLYNLVQLELRLGLADGPESLRRLRRANLKYSLAALCVEEGLHQKAVEILSALGPEERNGMSYRTAGDALMYLGLYPKATAAYQQAERTMPGDKPTRVRLECACAASSRHAGRILFPSRLATTHDWVERGALVKISHNSLALVGVSGAGIFCLNINAMRRISQAVRLGTASQPKRVCLGPDKVLVEDQTHFEIWTLPELTPLATTEARVLANSPDLGRLLLQSDSTLRLVELESGTETKLLWPESPPSRVCATFQPDTGVFHLLADDGRLAAVSSEGKLVLGKPTGPAVDIQIFHLNTRGELATVSAGGRLEVRRLSSGEVLYAHQLPFVPTSLDTDSSSRRLIVSSPTHSAVLDETGEFLFQSRGPLALNSRRTRFVAWEGGRLSMFVLRPFRRLRRWEQEIARPLELGLARDGRRAVTMGADGHYHVWEVDEDNRVYERALLLTPGQTYSELATSRELFDRLFEESKELARASRFPAAYESLCKARAVSGFHQAETALALQWILSSRLRRGGLEAIWERLTVEGVRQACISTESDSLALVHTNGLTVWRKASSKTSLKSIKTSRRLLGLHFMESESEGTLLATVDDEGKGDWHRLSDGELIGSIDCGSEALRSVKFIPGSLFFLTSSNRIGHYDLDRGKLTSISGEIGGRVRALFPVREHVTVGLMRRGARFLDLREGETPTSLAPDIRAQLTFLEAYPDRNLYLIGLSSGKILVIESITGNPTFGLDLKAGPITGFRMVPGLSIGVAVTAKGKLVLCDLSNRQILEQFTAHTAAIVDLQVSTKGRYITTITDEGQFRLWETSWLLEAAKGPPPLKWFPLNRKPRSRAR